jgi:hypothetical protein
MGFVRTVKVLEELGVPDRVGLIGGVREKVARLLIGRAADLGEDVFRELMGRLVEAVVYDAEGGDGV